MTKTSDLAARHEKPGQIVKEEIPEYLQGVSNNAGLEDMEQGDMVLPRLAIAQTLSPALKKSGPKYIQGLEEGMLFNTVTRKIYGESVVVVPLLFSKMRIKFKPIAQGGGIVCQSLNGINGGVLHPEGCDTCEFSKFGSDGKAPECFKFFNYACILPDEGNDLLAVSMKSTAVAVAKQWNSMMRLTNKPAFAKSYSISSVPESKNGNDYHQFKVEPVKGFVPEEIFKFGNSLYEQLKSQGIKVDLEDEDLQDPTQFETANM